MRFAFRPDTSEKRDDAAGLSVPSGHFDCSDDRGEVSLGRKDDLEPVIAEQVDNVKQVVAVFDFWSVLDEEGRVEAPCRHTHSPIGGTSEPAVCAIAGALTKDNSLFTRPDPLAGRGEAARASPRIVSEGV